MIMMMMVITTITTTTTTTTLLFLLRPPVYQFYKFSISNTSFSIATYRVQNGSGAHSASYPMGTRGSFPGGKVAGT
jgi:hypothetical protein